MITQCCKNNTFSPFDPSELNLTKFSTILSPSGTFRSGLKFAPRMSHLLPNHWHPILGTEYTWPVMFDVVVVDVIVV